MPGDFIEASVHVSRVHADLVEGLLSAQGALAVTLTDCADTPIWEPPVGETPLWERVTLTGLFPADVDARALAATLSLAPGVDAPGQVSVSGVEDRDWVRAWMDRFEPMRFGRRLWIVPTGMACPAGDAIELHLDPGLAFGTGTHATTRLALEWLEARDLAGKHVLDFGCGSGVLGIAAALMGAKRVTCIDNDPQAIIATRQNAQRNGVADRIEAREADTPAGVQADIVIANILSGILTRLAGELQAAVSPGGRIALTGILGEQADGVARAYAAGFPSLERVCAGHWVLVNGNIGRQ